MKVAVVGLGHLGCVTTACLTKLGHSVIAYDECAQRVPNLSQNKIEVYEPHLADLIHSAQKETKLYFTHDYKALQNSDVFWITYDTPVDEVGQANLAEIKNKLICLFPWLHENALVIISSQLPVGATREIAQTYAEKYHKQLDFVYVPENLRLGRAIELFLHPDRIIIGFSSEKVKKFIHSLFFHLAEKLIWVSVEAAEMIKHAINAFLATSITFINELALLCEQLTVDVEAVERGLKTDIRIGELAYLSPGAGFSGGTLLRDIHYLSAIGQRHALPMNLLHAILTSNQHHMEWIKGKIVEKLQQLNGKHIAILGLSYKSGTNALQHSSAIALGAWLHQQGAKISAYDPLVKDLSPELAFIALKTDLSAALHQADGIIVSSMSPTLLNTPIKEYFSRQCQPYIFDPYGFK
jgi:UDPglucose 6-dehydrogenase